MRIDVLRAGDKVINVTNDFVAVERANGEVDILPLVHDDTGLWVDATKVLTIGYGENVVQVETVDGVVITNF